MVMSSHHGALKGTSTLPSNSIEGVSDSSKLLVGQGGYSTLRNLVCSNLQSHEEGTRGIGQRCLEPRQHVEEAEFVFLAHPQCPSRHNTCLSVVCPKR